MALIIAEQIGSVCRKCGQKLVVSEWGNRCLACGFISQPPSDSMTAKCPVDGTALTNDITKFPRADESGHTTWHRLYYHDYLAVKDQGTLNYETRP